MQVASRARFRRTSRLLKQAVPSRHISSASHAPLMLKSRDISNPTTKNRPVTSRLQNISRHFTVLSRNQAEYSMASDNPRDHNNDDFQLNSLFNVKDKVALVTGKPESTCLY